MRTRPLSADEAALWARVMAGVRPLVAQRPAVPVTNGAPLKPFVSSAVETPARPKPVPPKIGVAPEPASRLRSKRTAGAAPSNTLDGTWDRQLARGTVSPDRTIDLHGHTLNSAHDLLDAALAAAIRDGDRTILLVTGKPPRPTSERPHAPATFRGAIRAATGDWLAGSRHAAAIAAVRPAHPRHGGAGALYIVLRKTGAPRKS